MVEDEQKKQSMGEDEKPLWEAPSIISVEVMEVMASSCSSASDPDCLDDNAAVLGKNEGACVCATLGS